MGYPNVNTIAQRIRAQDENCRERVRRIAIEQSEHGFVILSTFADPNDPTDKGTVGVVEHLTWDEMLGHVAALARTFRPAAPDIVLQMPTADAGPLARLQLEEMHRLLAHVLDAAGFAPGQEKAEAAIKRLLMQWRSGLEPRVPPAPGLVERPDWLDVPFTQPFATPVLMVEGAEQVRTYALSLERALKARPAAPAVSEAEWCVVDDLALSGKVVHDMEAGQPARSRLREELSAAVRERDLLKAKIAALDSGASVVVDREEIERLRGVHDRLNESRDKVSAALGSPWTVSGGIDELARRLTAAERERDALKARIDGGKS